ncbi:hypothetical protein HanXRQr2_Chr12g0534751 [Helianthus annuus]|uniref:Uncharacterized protein n=1 Tax=Helianthus annuus TaxID=4232 RepID=A0A9K3MV44_HELAN|nr:hypothetical protein HanXRQr2_Chr12g0534751 [Helianthus annuus]KAJ0492544.1 hypothetical protein HanIR_Chr12g0576091 [Helianthus annuus]KAJ0862175.1 hypothetical protein HanPSC8_Chr12g0515081 [Helianthus annuus]
MFSLGICVDSPASTSAVVFQSCCIFSVYCCLLWSPMLTIWLSHIVYELRFCL